MRSRKFRYYPLTHGRHAKHACMHPPTATCADGSRRHPVSPSQSALCAKLLDSVVCGGRPVHSQRCSPRIVSGMPRDTVQNNGREPQASHNALTLATHKGHKGHNTRERKHGARAGTRGGLGGNPAEVLGASSRWSGAGSAGSPLA